MEYIVDTFSFVRASVGYNLTVLYNDATSTFKVESNRPNIPILGVPDRQKLPYTQVYTRCDEFTHLVFKAQLDFPYVYLEREENASVCGYIESPEPPPIDPNQALPLIVDATAYPLQTETSINDGRITGAILGSYSTVIVSIRRTDSENVLRSILITSSTGTFEFNNLEAGEYEIKAYTPPGFAKAEGDAILTVEEYPFDEKYYFIFCEERYDRRKIRASIRKRGYDGISFEIKNAARDVAVIKYLEKGDTDQMKFKPVLGSECEINLMADEYFDLQDIYTSQEKEYLLELKYQDTQELIWSGFILPDQSQEPFDSKPYPITFKATDGIKVLEDVPFDISGTRMTFLEGLKYALDKTGIKLGFKTAIDIVNPYAENNAILEGYGLAVYGRTVVVQPGKHVVLGTQRQLNNPVTLNFNYPTSVNRYDYIALTQGSPNPIERVIGGSSMPKVPPGVLLLAVVMTPPSGDVKIISTTPYNAAALYFTDDTLADHNFNTDRFLKEDGEYENCYNVIEALCKQFTAQVKQCNGHWVIENIGNKSRNSTVLENAYDKDLNLLYKRQPVDLFRNLDCNQENKIISGAYLSNGAGWKRSEVIWKLGLPQPIVKNGKFEDWVTRNGALVPEYWEVTEPYNFFNRAKKYIRIYDYTNNSLVIQEDGTYYFNFIRSNIRTGVLRSSPVAVFNGEVVDIAFQLILNNNLPNVPESRNTTISFVIKMGDWIATNRNASGYYEPKWIIDDGKSYWDIVAYDDPNVNTQFTDIPNLNFSLPPAPIQGFLTISIDLRFSIGNNLSDVGFDNFKITKRSPISDAKTIKESTITVENKAGNYSKVPESYEVLFGDIDNAFRTDGIKDNGGVATTLWKRDSITELEPLNNLVARELLSQFQNTFKILEGEIIGRDLNIRNVFNLPEYSLYRFATITGEYNIARCTAKVTIAEVYAEEAPNSGAIGGGGGISHGDLGFAPINVLGYGNKLLTDGNNNIFLENGD